VEFDVSQLTLDDDLSGSAADPLDPRFWSRAGPGHAALLGTAWAHIVAGLLAGAICALLWLRSSQPGNALVYAAGAGAGVVVCGVVAALLSASALPGPAQFARALLPLADLVAITVGAWLLGPRDLLLVLFVMPTVVAGALLSARGVVVFAALTEVVYCTLATLQFGAALDIWLPSTLLLAALLVVTAVALGARLARVGTAFAPLLAELHGLRQAHAAQALEQARLLDGFTLIEETQARLEQERVGINTQIAEIAGIVRRMGEGDVDAVRTLQPGLYYGPLDGLSAALVQIGQQIQALAARSAQAEPMGAGWGQASLPESVAAGVREQGRLLAATDAVLRDLGMRANELAAEARAAEQDLGALPAAERDALFARLHDIERRALSQASDTAVLGGRLAQLLARQGEIEGEVRRVARASDPTLHAVSAAEPLWPAADPADAIARRLARAHVNAARDAASSQG
jgi:hypothetical protein